MIMSSAIKELAFSILDKSKFRGFHLLKDLRFYASEFNLPVETIFDVGANIGQTSTELRKYFPDASIHAFEPIDSTFEILSKNICNDRKTILNNIALGAEKKEVTIFLQHESLINSLLNEINVETESNPAQNRQTQIIQVLKGDEYCTLNKIESIFLLKTDTEGYDLDVLMGFEQILCDRKISFVLVEVTFDLTDLSHTSFYRINEYMTLHGYKLSGFYEGIYHGGFQPDLNYCNCLWALLPDRK
jgi:FkbM family methyltransferase